MEEQNFAAESRQLLLDKFAAVIKLMTFNKNPAKQQQKQKQKHCIYFMECQHLFWLESYYTDKGLIVFLNCTSHLFDHR